jgi:hypothetical protein
MDTLEQRVERLERSCRRWRLGFLVMVMAAAGVAGAPAGPGRPPDAQFGHLSVQSLAIRSQPDGPFVSASCDSDRASITLSSPTAPSVIALVATPDSADILLSRKGEKGVASVSVSADQQSGSLDLRNADGKDKELEPE